MCGRFASGCLSDCSIEPFFSNPDIPSREIRAGQHGIGKTVFSGNKIEEFQVEILGVLENLGPRQSVILARLSGGPLAKTGVMQGMSGSPVYIDGRLVGAVALAFQFRQGADRRNPAHRRNVGGGRQAPSQAPVAAFRLKRDALPNPLPQPARIRSKPVWWKSPRRSLSADSLPPRWINSRRN